jgi:hypothetical protein
VLAEHVVDVDVGGNGAVLCKMSDLDRRRAGGVEYQPQLAGTDGEDAVADRRVFRDAALKIAPGRRRIA